MAHVIVITGARGVGKSTLCDRIAGQVAAQGFRVAGIVTRRENALSSWEGGVDRRCLVDLGTGESVLFGSRANVNGLGDPAGDAMIPGGASTDELTPGWEFGREVFTFGERAIAAGADADMLVVDEVGPLELLGGRGWAGSLSVLRARAYRVALVVCRPHLVADLASTLGLRLGCPGPGPFTARIRPLSVETRETVEIAVVQEVLQLLRS